MGRSKRGSLATTVKALGACLVALVICATAAQSACIGGGPDGVVATGEECDDGNTNNNDNCLDTCTLARCNDSVLHTHGRCAGGSNPNGLCRSSLDCPGNGSCSMQGAQPLEQCDPPFPSGGAIGCDGNCQQQCGDGTRNASVGEHCDGTDLGGQSCTSATFCEGGSNNGRECAADSGCPSGDCKSYDGGPLACNGGCVLNGAACTDCGDGLVEGAEQCDPPFTGACVGGSNDGDPCTDGNDCPGSLTCDRQHLPCTADCQTAQCGDGVQTASAGESCDNGAAFCCSAGVSNGVECTSGAGKTACDADGGSCSSGPAVAYPACLGKPLCAGGPAICNADWLKNACRSSCTRASCGDGVADTSEFCDDGLDSGTPGVRDAADHTDVCPNGPATAARGLACRISNHCGDGIPLLTDSGARCQAQGDGHCHSGVTLEPCDGGSPGGTLEMCSDPACTLAVPGSAPMTCRGDPAVTCATDAECAAVGGPCGNSDTAPDACRTSCIAPACGDDVLDSSESCDDGKAICSSLGPDNGSPCSTVAGYNACTDDVGASCHHDPTPADAGVADCQGGGVGTCNMDAIGDYCRSNCATPPCGDGVTDAGRNEECDNASNNGVNRNCTDTCRNARCGDGKVDTETPGVEDCDDGNSDQNDACLNDCNDNVCGDTFVDTARESCDDGNKMSFDGCSADCCMEASSCDPPNPPCTYPSSFSAINCNFAAFENNMVPLPDNVEGKIAKLLDRAQLRTDAAEAMITTNPRRACARLRSAGRRFTAIQRRLDVALALGDTSATLHASLSATVALQSGWLAHVRGAACSR